MALLEKGGDRLDDLACALRNQGNVRRAEHTIVQTQIELSGLKN
ncbi:MAG TPA: hypothetical protein VJY33_14460 [Isosphaeraceae bacterium]|nr:hypothetical protein [Isosphaeraceae bacterium]